jgi:hypothetical protein
MDAGRRLDRQVRVRRQRHSVGANLAGDEGMTPSSSHSVERESPVAGGPKDPGRYPSVRAVATVSRKGVAGADGLLRKENVSRRGDQLRWPV